MSPLARLSAYAAHPDPRAAATNRIALIVAGNQPFYPFYLWWLVGGDWASAFWTFLSTPFFLAVPAVARRNTATGIALLPLAGIANTLWTAKVFGPASGVALFLMPCAMIAGMAFRRRERAWLIATLAAAAMAFVVYDRLGAPLARFTPAQYGHFASLNAWSVATLTAFAAWVLARD